MPGEGASRRRPSRVLLLGLAVLAAASVAPLVGPQASQAAGTFSVSAGADLVRVGFRIEPGVVVEQLLDPGAATAQAQLDSLGTSAAFAANPFPGTFALALPGTLAGAAGTPGAAYPLAATSSWPAAPTGRAQAGPLKLSADSGETGSESAATDGVSQASAQVKNDPITGALTAHAESLVSVVDFGGQLTLAGVRSSATAERRPGAELQRKGELSVARLTVLGRTFSVGPDGIQLTDQRVPGGDARAVLDPLLAQLAQAGVTLAFLAPAETADGIISGALAVTYRTEIPNQGVATVTATFGRTYVSAAGTATALPSGSGVSIGTGDDAVSDTDLGAGPAPGVDDGGAGDLSALPEPLLPPTDSPPFPLDGPPAVAGADPVPAGGAENAAPVVAPGVAATIINDIDTTPVSRLYPVLVVVALGVLGVVTLFRHRGVRHTWNS